MDKMMSRSSSFSVELIGFRRKTSVQCVDYVNKGAARIPDRSQSRFKKRIGLYLAAASCLLSSLSAGMVIGFTAPAEPKMESPSSKITLSKDEFSWFGSVMALGALLGGLVGGPMSDRFGRKAALLICAVPCFVGWMLITYGNNLIVLIFGRVFNGFYVGIVCVVAPQYLVEISTIDTRGALGTSFQFALGSGTIMSNLIGSQVDWTWLAIISTAPLIMMMISMACMPESPQWFVLRRRFASAASSLMFLHGKDEDTAEEMVSMSESMPKGTQGSDESNRFEFSLMKKRNYYLPSIYSLLLMFFQQCSGINAVSFYTVEIVKSSGTSLNPFVGSIIIYTVGVSFCAVNSFIVDRAGRRMLLMVSGAGSFVCLFCLGVFYLLVAKHGNTFAENFGWVGLVSLALYLVSFSIGFAPIPWMIIPEIVPPRAKSIVGGVAIALNWACVFFITKTFTDMNRFLQPYGTYWTYSLVAAGSCVFTWCCIPETKGKSLEEITQYFEGAKK